MLSYSWLFSLTSDVFYCNSRVYLPGIFIYRASSLITLYYSSSNNHKNRHSWSFPRNCILLNRIKYIHLLFWPLPFIIVWCVTIRSIWRKIRILSSNYPGFKFWKKYGEYLGSWDLQSARSKNVAMNDSIWYNNYNYTVSTTTVDTMIYCFLSIILQKCFIITPQKAIGKIWPWQLAEDWLLFSMVFHT